MDNTHPNRDHRMEEMFVDDDNNRTVNCVAGDEHRQADWSLKQSEGSTVPVLICRRRNKKGRSALKTGARDRFSSTMAATTTSC